MKIYRHRCFYKWAKKEKLNKNLLIQSIHELEIGLFNAKICFGIYKKRIARTGKGKSGGFRSIIAFRANDTAFFMYGYAKNEKEDLTPPMNNLCINN